MKKNDYPSFPNNLQKNIMKNIPLSSSYLLIYVFSGKKTRCFATKFWFKLFKLF